MGYLENDPAEIYRITGIPPSDQAAVRAAQEAQARAAEEEQRQEEGRREFEQLQQSGDIPKGATYTGKTDAGIHYVPPGELERAEEWGRQVVRQGDARREALNQLEPYKLGRSYDLASAIRAGKIETVRKAGFTPADIVEAQGAVAMTGRERFDTLKASGGIPKDAQFVSQDADGTLRYKTKAKTDNEPTAYQKKVIEKYESKGKVFIGPTPKDAKYTPIKESEGWQAKQWGASWMATPLVAAGSKAGPVAIIATAIAFIGTEAYLNNKDEIDAAIGKAIDNFKKRTGRVPSPAEVVIADKVTGEAMTMSEFRELGKTYETGSHGIKPVNIATGTAGIKPVNIKTGTELKTTHLPETGKVTKADPDAMGPTTKITWKEPVVLLPGTQTPIPRSVIRDRSKLSERAGMMVAAGSQVITTARPYVDLADVQRQAIQRALEAGRVREERRGKIIARRKEREGEEDEARRARRRARRQTRLNQLDDVVELTIHAALAQKLSADVRHALLEAHKEYQQQKALYEDAEKQFAKSGSKWRPAYGQASKRVTSAATEALARANTSNAERQAVDTIAATFAETQTSTKEATGLKQATRTGETTNTQTATRTQPAERITTGETTTTPDVPATDVPDTDTPTTTDKSRPLTPPLRHGAGDKEKREYIQKHPGAIAFRMGQLNDKDVWHVVLEPYASKNDHITLLGQRPKGATVVRGPDSAYKTAQLLYGKHLSHELSLDIGVQDAILRPISGRKGIAISFEADPNLSTRGDIDISGRGKVFPLERKRGKV